MRFFCRSGFRHSVGPYCKVWLANATHQLNCGSYVLWYDILVGDSGLRWFRAERNNAGRLVLRKTCHLQLLMGRQLSSNAAWRSERPSNCLQYVGISWCKRLLKFRPNHDQYDRGGKQTFKPLSLYDINFVRRPSRNNRAHEGFGRGKES